MGVNFSETVEDFRIILGVVISSFDIPFLLSRVHMTSLLRCAQGQLVL